MKFTLESRLRYVIRRFAEVGDQESADRLQRELDGVRAIWTGSSTSGLVEDLTTLRRHLRDAETTLLQASLRAGKR